MDICPNCQDTRGGNYCSDCGARLVRNLEEKRCPVCGVDVGLDRNFCFLCGWPLRRVTRPKLWGILWRLGFNV
jgi:predicted amidophosphoribosyltransferase